MAGILATPAVAASDDSPDPPARIYERLRQIAGYTWDESKPPFHSSYDNWHFFGTHFVSPHSLASATLSPSPRDHVASPSSTAKANSSRPSPGEMRHAGSNSIDATAGSTSNGSPNLGVSPASDGALIEIPIVARVSFHCLREERSFHIAKNLTASGDPNGEHLAKPVDLIRLAPQAGDRGLIMVAIYQDPGPNHLVKLLDMGPAYYEARKAAGGYEMYRKPGFELDPPIGLMQFLDFAIGATQCLEIIHHSQGIIHGEVRGDAFHFNIETNKVKLVSFGSGLRAFEHGLTSTGWSALSKEVGAKNKLLYISPEQTGRMPAEPDTRTDIYSLGVLMWSLLTQQQVYEGDSPLDIVQGVLGRRIPSVAAIRMDIPEVVARIIQKCTSKNIGDRYHSASGLRYDLVKVQEFLSAGDVLALKEWQIASKDVSSFFMLPSVMIGRNSEREQLLKVIERVAKSHAVNHKYKASTNPHSDGSTLSGDVVDSADTSSEGTGTASGDGVNRRSGSFTVAMSGEPNARNSYHSSVQPSIQSAESQAPTGYSDNSGSSGNSQFALRLPQRAWERHQSISFETKSLAGTMLSADTGSSAGTSERDPSRHPTEATSSLSRQLGSAKFRRRGHCEIVTIEGAGGLGKSCLVQSVLADARRRGYCATAKFDTARRTAFGPLLKLLSSLFRQLWGERNTETPFHMSLKQYVRPIWPMLHRMLGLPEFLLGPVETTITRSISSATTASSSSFNSGTTTDLKRRGSSPGSSISPSKRGSGQISREDFLRGGTSTKSIRLMNTFLDVLRMFTNHKFICFCIDDLHFADAESLDLITQIIQARMKMVIIVTYRPEEISADRVRSILLQQLDSDEVAKTGGPTITKIELTPLKDDEMASYVAATLCKPKEDVSGLSMIIQAKSAGNPFYMREMLNACYRKKCIWYDYHESQWHYDINKVFDQFKGDSDYDILNTDFVTSRLSELPPAARSILAWAALLGNTFSFELVCHLLRGEFNDTDTPLPTDELDHTCTVYTQQEAVAGLQAAIQAYIIVPSESDDRFRFAHDRYIQAALDLKESDAMKMHFIISQTLLKHYGVDVKSKDSTAAHICAAVELIKVKVHQRRPYRRLLIDCARLATENGARPTSAKYYAAAIALLQPNPWTDDGDDAFYEETLQLYIRTGECHLYMGQHPFTNSILDLIFENAKSALDKASANVMLSRIFSQNGDSVKALLCLKGCLKALDIGYDETTTFAKCDEEFEALSVRLQTADKDKILNPCEAPDPRLSSIGAVLSETISAAWWCDRLSFYHLSLLMMNLHLKSGPFAQSGVAFLHMAMVSLARFNMVQFAVDMGHYSLDILERFKDAFSMARGYMNYVSFVGHVQFPLAVTATQLEGSIEYGVAAGDRISAILAFGLAAQVKFFASEHCVDLEAFCQYACDEILDWQQDTRGGTFLIGVRQISRALQGKTYTTNVDEVLGDDQHISSSYKQWLQSKSSNGRRSLLFYESFELVALYLYGYYERAEEVGRRAFEDVDLIWTARNTRLIMFFYGLTLAELALQKKQNPKCGREQAKAELVGTLVELNLLKKRIQDWGVVCNVNYYCWWTILEAQIAELNDDHGAAITLYEQALDHASANGFIFEEALGNCLMAGIFIRVAARRSAKAAFRDALRLYRLMGATGIADKIEEEHNLLLHGPVRNPRTAEIGVQTDFAGDAPSAQYRGGVDAEDDAATARVTIANMTQLKGERLGTWRGSMQPEVGVGLPALDMIDLHAILQSSQVISSVLRVDQLLKTMCDVILQTCSGSATFAAIVVKDDEGNSDWCVAASGDPEKGAVAHLPGIPLTGTHIVAENVVLYSTRFREAVFIHDLINDERFGNVSDCWLQKNPLSKAVIAIPICQANNPLLGVLYLEGVPGSFTDRNVTVLQLLVNQVGISYSNAMSMKAVEKVSAENVSMVELQKRALHKAIEAENKAKDKEKEAMVNLQLAEAAEAEAIRNVKLAEEAAKAKGIFLANVSHELRTPLNGVIGNSELLRESNLNREQQDMAESIRLSADLLLTVINDILDFSRMEADKMKLYIIAFNPREMVQEVVRAVSYRNQERTSKGVVEIIKHLDLPPNLLVYGDPVRLHQVLGNLIGNSMKFTEQGSITIGVRLDHETDKEATITFWVQDTGIGIPPEQLAKLFQPFSQADPSTARKYGGSGLGLSICKSLIETIMKGKIYLDSTENVGTRAWFTVAFDKPRPEVSAGETPTPHHLSPDSSRTASSESTTTPRPAPISPNPYMDLSRVTMDQARVCIAEDNPINRKIAIGYVKRLGYRVADAYDNGLKAVEAMREAARSNNPYHVVLMDVQMPVLDGYEATKLLRKDPIFAVRNVLIIAMTASAIQGDREKCLAAGMNDYLAKPVKSDVLGRKLSAYIGAPKPLEQTRQPSTSSQATLDVSVPMPSPEAAMETSTSYITRVPTPPRPESNGPTASPPPDASPSPALEKHDATSSSSVNTTASTDTPLTAVSSHSPPIPSPAPALPPAKRQPKKLTKSRGGSISSAAGGDAAQQVAPMVPPSVAVRSDSGASVSSTNTVVEKPAKPGVLQKKKGPRRSGSMLTLEEGVEASPRGSVDGRGGSVHSQGS